MILSSEKASELLEGKCMGMVAKRKTDNVMIISPFFFSIAPSL